MGVQIQPKVEHGACANHAAAEVTFKVGPAEAVDRLATQLLEFGVLSVTQVEAGELVVPRSVIKAGNGAAVHFFLLGAEAVLIEKHRETFVETGIIGIAV